MTSFKRYSEEIKMSKNYFWALVFSAFAVSLLFFFPKFWVFITTGALAGNYINATALEVHYKRTGELPKSWKTNLK